MRNRKMIKQAVLLLLTGMFFFRGYANHSEATRSIFDLMHYQEVLEITLETDLALLREERTNLEYQKAELTFKDAHGQEQLWDMKVRIRGNFRRKFCSDIPPLKLKFKKDDLEAKRLADFNDMKLVTYCLDDKVEAKELILKEYLSYKFLNELTPMSYRVQLVKITYIDSSTGDKTRQWGIILEDTAQLKDRLGVKDCENCYNMSAGYFDQDQVQIVSFFQYLIGNSDWDLQHLRNIKLFVKDNKVYPVPYDFDFSGMVNAPYAIPNMEYQLDSIQQRIYLGFTEHVSEIGKYKELFLHKRDTFLEFTRQFKIMSLQSRDEVMVYLKSFYNRDIDSIKVPVKPIVGVEVDR